MKIYDHVPIYYQKVNQGLTFKGVRLLLHRLLDHLPESLRHCQAKILCGHLGRLQYAIPGGEQRMRLMVCHSLRLTTRSSVYTIHMGKDGFSWSPSHNGPGSRLSTIVKLWTVLSTGITPFWVTFYYKQTGFGNRKFKVITQGWAQGGKKNLKWRY